MTGEEMKMLAKRFYEEAFNQKHYEVIDELVADDYVEHEEFPGSPSGKEGVSWFLKLFHGAYSDVMVSIEDMAVEGNKLWVRYRLRGTHDGDFMGIPPTGKKIDVQGVDMVRLRDGKAAEHWGVFDKLSMLQQIGVIPEDMIG